MPAVETRKGIFATLFKSHFWCAVISFVLTLTAFKWLYALSWGIVVLFSVTAIVYIGMGVYSYAYYQVRVDLRDKGKYDWFMPFKIGGTASILIAVPAVIHILLLAAFPKAGELFGLVARFWNYPFFWFFYGRNGDWFNYTAMIIVAILPVLAAYISYYLGIKRFSFAEKINKMIYKK